LQQPICAAFFECAAALEPDAGDDVPVRGPAGLQQPREVARLNGIFHHFALAACRAAAVALAPARAGIRAGAGAATVTRITARTMAAVARAAGRTVTRRRIIAFAVAEAHADIDAVRIAGAEIAAQRQHAADHLRRVFVGIRAGIGVKNVRHKFADQRFRGVGGHLASHFRMVGRERLRQIDRAGFRAATQRETFAVVIRDGFLRLVRPEKHRPCAMIPSSFQLKVGMASTMTAP